MEGSIVLEVGMSDGYDTVRMWERLGLPIYGFEPVPKMYEHITNRFKDNKNIHAIAAAVDIEDGTKDFHLSNTEGRITASGTNPNIHPYGCSSLYEFSDDIHEKWEGRPDFNMTETISVKTYRLDTFLDENNFNGEITYLHCDAQGNDVNVLRSLGKYLKCVKEGVIEVAAQVQLYKGTNNTVDVATKFLTSNGFVCKALSPDRPESDIYFKRL